MAPAKKDEETGLLTGCPKCGATSFTRCYGDTTWSFCDAHKLRWISAMVLPDSEEEWLRLRDEYAGVTSDDGEDEGGA